MNVVTGELRAGGLGRHAHALHQALTETPCSIKELVRRTGMARNTVRKHLRALQEVGLAESTSEGWKRLERDLDELAEAMGVKGRSEEVVMEHRMDRERWKVTGRRIAVARGRRRQ